MRATRALRRAAVAGTFVALAWLAGLSAGQRPDVPDSASPLSPDGQLPVAAVGWPPSAGLLVGEVVTRGAGASDQYVEIYNAASVPLSLVDLELVYVTASGATVTRKQAWSDLALGPGGHLLIANSAGAFADQADGLFSGGFSTTGGSLVLRVIGGSVIDALSWGAASSSFVEGAPGSAPPTGASLERLPGAELGNAIDTNDNLADTHVQAAPTPQNLAAPPLPATPAPTPTNTAPPSTGPAPTDSPAVSAPPYEGEPSFSDEEPPGFTPSPTTMLSPTPSPTPTLSPTPTPTPTLSPTPTPMLSPTPTSTPTPAPTPTPTPTPSPSSTPSPSASETAAPPPSPIASLPTIAEVRAMPVGSNVSVRGVLTTPLGLTESGKGAFVHDGSAGIALYLADASWPAAPAGTSVEVSGALETRFSLLTIRLADANAIQIGQTVEAHLPLTVTPADVDESVEGELVVVEAVVSESAAALSDGFSTAISDGLVSLRVVVAGATGIDDQTLARGRSVRLTGVIGQRDSSGTGIAGYRLHPRSAADVVVLATPTPTPSATPTTRPSPTLRPTPTTRPTAAPTIRPTPTGRPAPISIASALRRAGETVTVEGIVTAPAALLDADARRVTIQDNGAAILLRLPLGSAAPPVGQRLRATGVVGTYYGAPQLAADDEPQLLGRDQPSAATLARAPIPPDLEWRLVSVSGVVESVSRSGDAWRAELAVGSDTMPVVGLGRSGIPVEALVAGHRATVIGLVRRAYPTAVDQRFAVVPRSRGDIKLGAAVDGAHPDPLGASAPPTAATASPDPADGVPPNPSGSSDSAILRDLADVAGRDGSRVRVAGEVVLVDGRRVVIRDESGSVALELKGEAIALAPVLSPGTLVNAIGTVGRDQRGGIRVVVERRADLLHAAALPGGRRDPATIRPPVTLDPAATTADTGSVAEAGAPGPADGSKLPIVLGALALLGLMTGSAAALLAGRRVRLQRLRTALRERLRRPATPRCP